MLTDEQAKQLKEAGLDAYNHNLDTSRENYRSIIKTRTYDDRLQTLKAVREAGITVCSGGIIGMGESIDDRCEMLRTLANLEPQPESVPINALVPVEGTPLADMPPVDPLELVRMIAIARILMPKSRVRLSAGRNGLSREAQLLCMFAGANSIFYGDTLLTTPNPEEEDDRASSATPACRPCRLLPRLPSSSKPQAAPRFVITVSRKVRTMRPPRSTEIRSVRSTSCVGISLAGSTSKRLSVTKTMTSAFRHVDGGVQSSKSDGTSVAQPTLRVGMAAWSCAHCIHVGPTKKISASGTSSATSSASSPADCVASRPPGELVRDVDLRVVELGAYCSSDGNEHPGVHGEGQREPEPRRPNVKLRHLACTASPISSGTPVRAACSGSASSGGVSQCGSATRLQRQSDEQGHDGDDEGRRRARRVMASSLRRRTRSRATTKASTTMTGET